MDQKRRDFLSVTAAAATLTAAAPLLGKTVPPAATEAAAAQMPSPTVSVPGYAAATEIKKIDIINLRELEGLAQKVIPSGGFGYISSAAGDEWTRRENEAAYKRMTIMPHYLSGYKDADMTTTLLGSKIAMPIITSVMGGHGMAHVTAEAGTAKGTDAAGHAVRSALAIHIDHGTNRHGQPWSEMVSDLLSQRSGRRAGNIAARQGGGISGHRSHDRRRQSTATAKPTGETIL